MTKRIAVITGASRGIGRCVAQGLAADGYHCCLVARSGEALKQAAEEISMAGGSASTFAADLSDVKAIEALTKELSRKFNRCDLLFNNAGVWYPGVFDTSLEQFDQLLAVNLKAPWLLMRDLLPILRNAQPSFVINLVSTSVREGSARTGTYGCTKRALLSLNESAHKLFAKDRVKVAAICPGWVDTVMAQTAGTPHAPKEMIQSEDILETIRWILRLSPAATVRDVFIDCHSDIR